jgi:HEAT repeat protein
MSYRCSLAPALCRPAALRPAFALLLVAGAYGGDRAAADSLARDPVAELRQALIQEKDAGRDKESLRFRRETLTRKVGELKSLGEMARALLLQEWRVEGLADPVADVDREVRDSLADRFIAGLKDVLAKGTAAQRMAACELISNTATAARPPGGGGFRTGFLRQRLAGLAPDLAKLTNDPEPGVVQFAARAIGNIQADPKLAVGTLERLIKTGTPVVRAAAADALVNLVTVIAQQEKKGRSDLGRGDLRDDLLATGVLAVSAAKAGFAPEQPVRVRRLSADALQQISSALLDLVPDPFPADSFPPTGRPWTAGEAERIEQARETVTKEREQLRPLLDAFGKQSPALAAASLDPDPYVRIQIRNVLQDLAVTNSRLTQRAARIPRGEGVPAPRPEPKPDEAKDRAPKTGLLLPPTPPAWDVPTRLVAQEKEQPRPARPGTDALAEGLKSSLGSIIAGLADRNVRGRLDAVEVLENMGTDAAPAIPALVERLSDPDRFVRWAAVRTLGRLAPRLPDQVVPAAARLLDDDDLDVQVAAAGALERYGPQAKAAVAQLGRHANQGDADIRIAAMKALQAIGTDAAPALPSVALNLVENLSNVAAGSEFFRPGPTTPAAERAALSSAATLLGAPPAAKARVAAAETLGRFGKLAEPAVPILQRALTDLDPEVRRAASEAILRITGAR